jgi:triosephosphate isomerase
MRQPIVAGNWKMNGSLDMAADLLGEILAGLDEGASTEVAICPPFVLIPSAAERLRGSAIAWGAQDLDVHEPGAYTGAVAGEMLRDLDCRYCIVGHSERRTLYGESDELVAKKFERAQRCGLTPILCIGETLEERERNETESVLARQLDAVVGRCGIGSLADAVLAYEPVWAIGTGKTASPEQAQQAHAFVRSKLSGLDRGVAEALRIQYGGSVKAGNAAELFRQPDIDGGLIGGAALKAEDFLAICRAAGA